MTTEHVPHFPNSGSDRDTARLTVLNIQRTCVHDGPGIRTTVFFRGCPLRCTWCQNPEAQPFVSPSSPDSSSSVSEILSAVKKDSAYYRTTHGGLTLSGGEPLAQNRAALLSFLGAAKREDLHVTVETAGDVPWSAFESCSPHVDLFLFDLKVVGDEALHEKLTGARGRRVEENLRRLVAAGANLRVRMCIVPDHNNSVANLQATAALLKSIDHPTIELMRYYNLHEKKALRLKISGLQLAQEPLRISAERSARALQTAKDTFTSLGIEVFTNASDVPRRKATFTQQVHRIQRDIRDFGYHVCLESAKLKTTYHKKHGFIEPLAVRRANLLRYLLNNKQVTVYPGELLVGNFTSKRVGGSVWVEYFASGMVITLWNIDRQKPIKFTCSLSDKLLFYTQLAPFWASSGLLVKAFPSAAELGKFVARTVEKRCGFNNNVAGIAHYIVNCERLLRLGTIGIAQEARDQREDRPDTGFYDGVLIALKGLEEFADRYAAHLRAMAQKESDARRRGELEHMAQICAHVPRNPARTFHEALQAILLLQIALCTESFENAIPRPARSGARSLLRGRSRGGQDRLRGRQRADGVLRLEDRRAHLPQRRRHGVRVRETVREPLAGRDRHAGRRRPSGQGLHQRCQLHDSGRVRAAAHRREHGRADPPRQPC